MTASMRENPEVRRAETLIRRWSSLEKPTGGDDFPYSDGDELDWADQDGGRYLSGLISDMRMA
jgi:hypothetical protein